jgi:hypothetical protein
MIRNLLSLMLALILVIGAEQVVAQVGDTSAAQVARADGRLRRMGKRSRPYRKPA